MINPDIPTVLSIAGSDPSGGAGIQADLKTMTSLGVYGTAIITCLTVQNSKGVTDVVPLDDKLLFEQIKIVFADHYVTHIKLGMLGTSKIASTINKALDDFTGEVIWDPVLSATTGKRLTRISVDAPVIIDLFNRVTVLIPNISELSEFCKIQINSRQEAIKAGCQLLDSHKNLQAVVIKGGHLEMEEKEICDHLLMRNLATVSKCRQRIQTSNLHGTGCTFASAFAALHSRYGSYQEAFAHTGDYMDRLISRGSNKQVVNSRENGPLIHYMGNTEFNKSS